MRPSQKRQMLAFSVSALGLGVIVISVFMTLTQEYCKGFLISAFLGAILVALGIISNAREADRIRSKGYQ